MIYSYRHSKHWSNVQPLSETDFAEALANLPSLVEQLKIPKSITTVKPDRAPPQILRDTCDGIHPTFTSQYLRKVLKS
jgi:hypothetical protein